MFENVLKFFKRFQKDKNEPVDSKSAAKERLHLVLMQDRANVSADFLDLMKQEIIDVIKKYIEVDENAIDVRLTNKENEDGTNGAPALYANIPIVNIKNEARKVDSKDNKKEEVVEDNSDNIKEEVQDTDIEDNNVEEQEEVEEKDNSVKEENNNKEKESIIIEGDEEETSNT